MWIMKHGTLIDISFNKVSLINYKAITGVKFLLGDILRSNVSHQMKDFKTVFN